MKENRIGSADTELCTFQLRELFPNPLCFDNRSYGGPTTTGPDSRGGGDVLRRTSIGQEEDLEGAYEEMTPREYANVHYPRTEAGIYAECVPDVLVHDAAMANNYKDGTLGSVDENDITEKLNELDKILLKDESLHVTDRFRLGKRAYSFWNFVFFAGNVMHKEVEELYFLDVFYLLIGLHLLVLGSLEFSNCKMSVSLSSLVLIFGACAVVSSITYFSSRLQKRGSVCRDIWRTTYIIFRMSMMVSCLLGLAEIYMHFPPEEYDTGSSSYCSSRFYWGSLFVLTLTTSIAAVTFVMFVLVLIWYFL